MTTTTPSILAGGTYLHAPSGRAVVVVDHEYRHRPRAPSLSAPTGRFIVRDSTDPGAPLICADPLDLVP